MDLLGYLLVGGGLFVCYSAYKGQAPWDTFKAQTFGTPEQQTQADIKRSATVQQDAYEKQLNDAAKKAAKK